MPDDEVILIRVGDEEKEVVRAEMVGQDRARLLGLPDRPEANIYDVVQFDPYSEQSDQGNSSYRMLKVVEPSGYRSYLTWALMHRPEEFPRWRQRMEEQEIVVKFGKPVANQVRELVLGIPPHLSSLEALVLFNRFAPAVEIVSPLLAAHADDLDRAKEDLERVVAWGANDAEVTYAVAEAFETQGEWDEAVTFWERLSHILPDVAAANERLAICYAHLGVYHMAASAFDRAADLAEEPDYRARLREARDLMWKRSKV